MNKTLKREIDVAIHGQSAKFRIIKYSVLVPIMVLLFVWGGWSTVLWFLLIAIVAALLMHLFYRNKTNTWTKSWGGYKTLKSK